ncbi:MAG TPA: LEA type 2 family protein [Gemmatirosa sp.]
MRQFTRGTTVAAVAAGIAVAGCVSIGRQVFTTPLVSFTDVQINGLGLQGGSLDVVLNVYNPNHYGLSAQRLDYQVLIDSVPLGTGAITRKFDVHGSDSTQVRLPVTFSYAGLGSAGRALMARGVVNYRVLGNITVGTPIGNFTRPFDRTGQYNSLGGFR